MIDITLLRILKHKHHYDNIVPDLPNNALQDKTRIIIRDFGQYLQETGHPVIHMREFKEYFFSLLHPNLTPDKQEYYNTILDRCDKDVDEKTAEMMINKVIELSLVTEVSNIVDQYSQDVEIDAVPEIERLLEKAQKKSSSSESETYVRRDIKELLEEEKQHVGLNFRLHALQQYLRPLRGGDFLIVAGRPDTGKTSFISSEVTFLATQLPVNRPVLWFNNEGHGDRIIKRIYQSALGATVQDLVSRSNRGCLEDDYQRAVGHMDQIRVIDCHGWDNRRIEKVVRHMTPGLVVFDMIDNITFKGSRYDARTDQVLESMYQWARELSVTHNFVSIATSQVSSEAEQSSRTQCYPGMSMLKDSKTGKQGAADAIIMIGRSNERTLEGLRYISAPKNKLAENGGTFNEIVTFDKERGRYEDRDT